ncbi:MAG: hypothetical protein IKZ61_11870 [Prevotella sp.]|nr:hypothetical protein [Prevotella sp.]
MKASKKYLSIVTLAVAAISFVVMVAGFFIHRTVVGFFALWVFALSSYLFVHLCIPDDDFGKKPTKPFS